MGDFIGWVDSPGHIESFVDEWARTLVRRADGLTEDEARQLVREIYAAARTNAVGRYEEEVAVREAEREE
ncbi:hypothetical protein [Streptomyces hoynatensis]|uniref:Uncharacterized protein n=1 Tax=Streptomyces hoynatensis TaxID=1141874 RepID=A0A3A9YT29_9ACTN|nr:hypothetical protein [Streptomyces hoynatensis]RKN39193.1 hypothetical protein D7294_21690 [Streptomyces hoynatensis]